MSDSIKTQIKARIKTDLQALVTSADIRKLAWQKTILFLEPLLPAIHLVAGDEARIDEDSHGYTMEFPLEIKLCLQGDADLESKTDALVQKVQATIEADLQLNQLANLIRYDGETPYLEDLEKPNGGSILHYTVQYRRAKAHPDQNY
jgi:hypothetical protein